MRDIYGRDIGTLVPLRDGTTYRVSCPWPDDTHISAGRAGVVLTSTRQYLTAFVEVYPPDVSFIRGEGATLAEAEAAAWRKYQTALVCPVGKDGQHVFEPYPSGSERTPAQKYTNGAGFCRYCNTFQSAVFTGEELGQFCVDCGVGTVYGQTEAGDWYCQPHAGRHRPARPTSRLGQLFHDLTYGLDEEAS